MPVGGVVDEVLVKEGDAVRKGQILLRLDTVTSRDRQQSILKTIAFKQQQLRLKREELVRYLAVNDTEQQVLVERLGLESEVLGRLETLNRQGAVQELQYLSQVNKVQEVEGQIKQSKVERLRQEAILQQGIRELQSELADLRSKLVERLGLESEVLGRLETLNRQGAVQELQYLSQVNKVQEVEGQIKQSKVERLRQEAILQQGIRELQSELADLRSKLVELDVNIRYQEIRAPEDGVVFELKPKSKGFVAQTSEPVMKVVPYDRLEARVEVPSREIGFVSVGKRAEISIDSYPSTDFGVLQGTVRRIGSDALPPDERDQSKQFYRFPVDIKLNQQQMRLKSGQPLDLKVGMSLTANIKLRKVTYLQLLLSDFKDKADALRRI
jgi:multidrug efflux pump subunit AcrA (membrane-fusion protein)